MDVLRQNEPDKFVSASIIKSTLGVSSATLRNWGDSGKVGVVRFGGSGKRSDVESMFKGFPQHRQETAKVQLKGRVSSAPQKDDLERQVRALQEAFPQHEVVRDIGSGINWRRPGLLALLDRALRGDVQEIVVAHRDRLCRFAFELLEHVLARVGCKVVVQHQSDEDDDKSDESELKDDLLSILTAFVASNNGRRSAAHRRARASLILKQQQQSTKEETSKDRVEGDQVPEMGNPPIEGAEGDPQALV